jgi:glucose 1-dehydrogenase
MFKHQVAIITGAGEGIGLEIAKQLTRQGANVLLNDIDETLAKDVAKNLNNCIGVGGDVGNVQVVQNLVTQAVNHFGKLDMLISNAGLTL